MTRLRTMIKRRPEAEDGYRLLCCQTLEASQYLPVASGSFGALNTGPTGLQNQVGGS